MIGFDIINAYEDSLPYFAVSFTVWRQKEDQVVVGIRKTGVENDATVVLENVWPAYFSSNAYTCDAVGYRRSYIEH